MPDFLKVEEAEEEAGRAERAGREGKKALFKKESLRVYQFVRGYLAPRLK
jgi:hypothetical protein